MKNNKSDKKVLMIGALGDGPDGMSQATIVLRDIWLNDSVPLNIVDFFENGGSGVGVNAIDKIKATFINLKIAKQYIPNVDSVYMTPKLSPDGFLSCIPYFKACIKHNVPYSLHFHGRAFQRNYKKYTWMQKFYDKYVDAAACNVALTKSLLDEIKALGIKGNWVTVGNYSQDFMMLHDDEVDEKKKSYSAKPLKIAYLSNVIESKGIFELMEAVSNDDRFSLNIAGRVFPDEKTRFDKLLESSNNINFLGFVGGDEKREMLKSSAIKALPTEYPTEAQPISVIEALCLGCIIISTTHIGIMDTLGKDYPKELYVKRETKDIKKRLIELYDKNCEQGKYVLKNIKAYQETFSQQKYADSIYNTLSFK